MGRVDYREATATDVAAIARLHAESRRNTYRGTYSDAYLDGPVFEERLAVWQERLSSPAANQFVVVADDRGAIVGFGCAFGNDSPQWGTRLGNLHVRLDLQRRGIGKGLVIEVARWCAANYPGSGFYLGVLNQNERAQAFYKALGAADVGGDVTQSPGGGGGSVPFRKYVWTPAQVRTLSAT